MASARPLPALLLALLPLLLVAALVSTPRVAADEAVIARVTEAYIELHTGPGRGYPIFYVAERGESVTVLKQRTDWVKVRTRKGKEGWVRAEAMAKTVDLDGKPMAFFHPDIDDYRNRRWEGGALAGLFEKTDAIGVYGAYHFTRNLSLEAEYSEYFGAFSNGRYGSISVVNQPFPNWRLSPFFTLGAGMIEIQPKATLVQARDRTDDMLIVGAGLRWYWTRNFLVRFQYKNYVVLTSRDDDEVIDEWKIGFSTFF
jgi:uncharacterized protein YgiM (DUF1202 family)